MGPHLDFPRQRTIAETEKRLEDAKNSAAEMTRFFVLTKDGRKVGQVCHFNPSTLYPEMEIGFSTIPSEQGKGYAAEAAQIMVDYLFLTREVERIQATATVDNVASQKVLLAAGFRKEGEIRKVLRIRGNWVDCIRFSLLREEWKAPHILQTA